ncbi:hypothetical protein AGOR_G00223230 [Albula goreensis]|uniref:NID domain-containing protein n=1 Tax=Albula goreensis TaxID=1534307 RepID=A0A8T3CMZ2_9TELE|nr:hypothetical protein AGOR_G00223230 [Albula goreensis]
MENNCPASQNAKWFAQVRTESESSWGGQPVQTGCCRNPVMSSDEDFSLVSEDNEATHLSKMKEIKMEIESLKVVHDRLVADKKDLRKASEDQLNLAEEYRKRSEKLRTAMNEEEQEQAAAMEEGKVKLEALQEEETRLKEELQRMEEELHLVDQQVLCLQEKAEVPTAVPEKNVVFTGTVREGAEASSGFHMESHIVYPMEGGTALISFEDPAVAQRILSLRQHEIHLGECYIRLEAKPFQVLVPSSVELATHVCPKSILVSEVPKDEEESRLLDRLEIHFSKRRNGGGEVDDAYVLNDSGHVVITFVEDTVAKGLGQRQFHEVDIDKHRVKQRVKVTPFLKGEITDLKMRSSVCKRTVLLTEIPAIMDPGDLQDQLEIYFQKTSNGGGEVDFIAYNPPGHRVLAVFEEDRIGLED